MVALRLVLGFGVCWVVHGDREAPQPKRRFLADQQEGPTHGSSMVDFFENPIDAGRVEFQNYREGVFQWANHPDKCLAVDTSSDDLIRNGASIVLQRCDPTNIHQRFIVHKTGFGFIRSAASPFKCIDVQNGANKNGNRIQVWDCQTGNPAQSFSGLNGLKQDRIMWRSDKCLDVRDHGDYVGNTLQLWECLGWNSDQIFSFDPSDGRFIALGNRACPPRTEYFRSLTGVKPVSNKDDCVKAAEALSPRGGCYDRSWNEIVRELNDPTFPKGCMIYSAARGGCGLLFNPVGKGSGCPGALCSVNVLCSKVV